MSQIIMQADSRRGILHQVKAGEQHYWISTVPADFPLARICETMIFKCNKTGKIRKAEFVNPTKTILHGSWEEAAKTHEKICKDLENWL